MALGAALGLVASTAVGAAAEPGAQTPEPAERSRTVVSADLTTDGFDHYRFAYADDTGPDAGPAEGGGTVLVTTPSTNNGGNLRSVWWFEGERPTVDEESCATWSEYSGPIVQAGVALRVRRVGSYTQAITVTNNIMWGARNGWNVHLWKGGTHGELIGQAVLSHSFGSSVFTQPPLPWRLCARVVGTTLQFKAWSLATHAEEPAWTDPGFGTSFVLPRGWVYPGYAGWYVGHLRPGDAAGYRSLRSGPLRVGALDRLAVASHTLADDLQRRVAGALARVLEPIVR